MSATNVIPEFKPGVATRTPPFPSPRLEQVPWRRLRETEGTGYLVMESLGGVFCVASVLFLLVRAITLGPIATAGFFAWLSYLVLFIYLLWRDEEEA